MTPPCRGPVPERRTRLVALTGGPGAGKTAIAEVVRRQLCEHVLVLPEAATILFSAGFPRGHQPFERAAAQRAIFHVQVELERMAVESGRYSVVLCDRGTVDGQAYWPYEASDLFAAVGTTTLEQLARYALVIHLRTPAEGRGYNHDNPLRVENNAQAMLLDEAIAQVWQDHPRRVVVESTDSFLSKVEQALALIEAELPADCAAGCGRAAPVELHASSSVSP